MNTGRIYSILIKMDIWEIKVYIHREQALYNELYSAFEQGREYQGGIIMMYSESDEWGEMVARFELRDKNRKL